MINPVLKVKRMSLIFLITKIPDKISRMIYYKIRPSLLKIFPESLSAENFYEFKPKCLFALDGENKSKYREQIIDWHLEKNIIWEANRVCYHIFDLLGSGDYALGENIAWNVDFKTGFHWKNDFYKNIKLIDIHQQADVKVVWELSRFQHLFVLGKAYWITQDEKYALEFAKQIVDWINENPVEFSVNWTSPMDVAIRAINWVAGYCFFKDSPSLDHQFWMNFHKLLYLHGKFIKNNLENRALYNGNHYLANLAGLICLGIYFGDHYVIGESTNNNPKVWLAFGAGELEKQMFIQVNQDGTDYESSTSYHRLVTEIFLLTTIFCTQNGIYYSKKYMNRLKKMLFFLLHIMKPNGLIPLLGDADDGRLMIFSNYYGWNKQDSRYIFAIAGEFFENEELRFYGSKFQEDALWALGSWRKPRGQSLRLGSKALKNGGYYLLKNERIYCLIRCGELSCHGEGGHSHNDQLSLILTVDGIDMIVDPGLYVYSADYQLRNYFRSTGAHNTLCIQGYEQNQFDPHELFAMYEQSYGQCLEFSSESFTGIHQGYKKKLGLIHERSVYITKKDIVLQDVLIGQCQGIDWYLSFMLAPDIEVFVDGTHIKLKKNATIVNLQSNEQLDIKVIEGMVSRSYGQLEPTKQLIVRSCSPEKKSLTLWASCNDERLLQSDCAAALVSS